MFLTINTHFEGHAVVGKPYECSSVEDYAFSEKFVKTKYARKFLILANHCRPLFNLFNLLCRKTWTILGTDQLLSAWLFIYMTGNCQADYKSDTQKGHSFESQICGEIAILCHPAHYYIWPKVSGCGCMPFQVSKSRLSVPFTSQVGYSAYLFHYTCEESVSESS